MQREIILNGALRKTNMSVKFIQLHFETKEQEEAAEAEKRH